MNIYNCHTHLFNLDCTPDRFLEGMAPSWVGKIGAHLLYGLLALPTVTGWGLRLANQFPAARKYAAFLGIGSSLSPLAIFEKHLLPAYPTGTRFVALPINFDLMGAGKAPLNQESQLWQLLEVRKRYPNTCLPFVSVDPRQGTAAENRAFVERWIGRGFVGIKLYPALGFYPFDKGLDEVYGYAEQNGLPIMTHCSRGGIYYQGGLTTALRRPDLPSNLSYPLPSPPGLYDQPFPLKVEGKETNASFCDYFLDPRAYELVLDRFPKLKICLAHYGGAEEIQLNIKNPGSAAFNWYQGVRALLANPKYPNVYTDVSYTLADKSLFETLAADLLPATPPAPLRERVLFGTDFFMTTQEKPEDALASELMTDLLTRDPTASAWQQLANENPTRYLHSKAYTPVERSGLAWDVA
ncbi:putative TIM-barrel fold metal-dependent hydrolase [Hymenobacter sp. UYAg731]